MVGVLPVRGEGVRGWQRWAPYAAVAWSFVYGALAFYWAAGGRGFPYEAGAAPDAMGPVVGRLGPVAAWVVVMAAGIPAAGAGTAMLRGMRGKVLRPLLITAGALLAAVFLFLTSDLTLLVTLAYIPYAVVALLTGAEFGQGYVQGLAQWTIAHQLLCLVGGFLWLAATVSYARRSGDACLNCGRRDGPEGWTSPSQAARWGGITVYVGMAVPVVYAATRYAWALGFRWGSATSICAWGRRAAFGPRAYSWRPLAWWAPCLCSAWCSAGARCSRAG